jgi:starch synthase
MIDDGVTGRLVPPGEAGPLAEALIELLADPEKTEDMGRAAYARVLEQFTWGHMAERFFSHLAALGVSPSRPSAAG